MLTLTIHHHYTQLHFDYPQPLLERQIKQLVSYEVDGAFFAGPYAQKQKSLYSHHKFPTGFLPQLLEFLQRSEIPCALIDHRGLPEYTTQVVPLCNLAYRPYQVRGITEGLLNSRMVFQWPPGTGKTELLLGLIASLGYRKTLWLTSSKNVLFQTDHRIGERIPKALASIDLHFPQTLWKRVRSAPHIFLKEYGILIIDECHHTQSDTWYRIAMNCNAKFRFGTSATPFEAANGNIQLFAAISGKSNLLTYADCYRNGWLSQPHVRMVHYHTTPVDPPTRTVRNQFNRQTGSSLQAPRWDKLYEQGIACCTERNALAVAEARRYLEHNLQPLIITRFVKKHAHPLRDLCKQAGLRTELVTGSSDEEQRVEAIGHLIDRKCDVLIASCILGEGQDIPDLPAIINLVAGDSKKQTVQITGRTMRPQSPSFVTDFQDDQHHILQRHSNARRESYREIGAEIEEVR